MIQTIEAVIDEGGNVRPLELIEVTGCAACPPGSLQARCPVTDPVMAQRGDLLELLEE